MEGTATFPLIARTMKLQHGSDDRWKEKFATDGGEIEMPRQAVLRARATAIRSRVQIVRHWLGCGLVCGKRFDVTLQLLLQYYCTAA